MDETETALAAARPKEHAMIEALNRVSRAAAALGANQPPLFGSRAKLLEEHLHAYEDAVLLIIDAELDA